MGYDIIIGRSEKDREKFGKEGAILLGKHYVKMGQTTSLSNEIYLDVSSSHVVFVVGKRGSGKCLTEDSLITLDNGLEVPIKDLENNSLGTDTNLWIYTLEDLPDPYDGDPIDGTVFTHFVTDEVGDAIQQGLPGQPTFYFDENDIIRVSAAVVGDRLVVSVEVVGTMNNTQEATGMGTDEVDYRDISIGLDLDNNAATGYSSWGMDIQITLYRGLGVYPDCQWGVYEFNEEDTHVIDRFAGQMHHGGQGYNYAVFSAPVSAVGYLGVDIEKGMAYKIMGWSEAETQNGTMDFAADTITQGGTAYIPTVLGGE